MSSEPQVTPVLKAVFERFAQSLPLLHPEGSQTQADAQLSLEVPTMAKHDPKWLQHAGERMRKNGTEGALHRKLGVPEDEPIPMSEINTALKNRGLSVKTRKQLQFAKTAKKIAAKHGHTAEAAVHRAMPGKDYLEKLRSLRLDPDLVEKAESGLVYHGDVYWAGLGLKQLPDLLWKVTGDMDVSNNDLTSLKNAPAHVLGDFICFGNKLPEDVKKPTGVHGKFIPVQPRTRPVFTGAPGQIRTKVDSKHLVRLEKLPAPDQRHDDLYGRAHAGHEPQLESLIAWAADRGITVRAAASMAPQLRGALNVSVLGIRWELREDKRDFNESTTRRRWQGKVHVPGHDAVAVLLARDNELTVSVTVAPGPRMVVQPTKIQGLGVADLRKLLTHASKQLLSKLKLEEPETEEA